MLDEVYRVFGLSYTAELSTRPESRMGEEAQWDRAETALQEALEAQQAKTGHGWKVYSLLSSAHCTWQKMIIIIEIALELSLMPERRALSFINGHVSF